MLDLRRRQFLTLLGGAAAWPLVARAQQPAERMRRLGVLMSIENDPDGKAQLSGFVQGLAEIGWTDGRNLRMEIRWGGGDVNRIRTFAKELVALQPRRDPCARNAGDCGIPTGDADDPDRICDCHRSGRGWVRGGTTPSRREYHRLLDIGIRNNR